MPFKDKLSTLKKSGKSNVVVKRNTSIFTENFELVVKEKDSPDEYALSTVQQGHERRVGHNLVVLFALWKLAFAKEIHSERLGLFWWFAEPLMIVLVVTSAALLFHGAYIMDMPTFPFAVMGVVLWLTFRTTFITTANGVSNLIPATNDPLVSRFNLLLVRSLRGSIANLIVAFILLGWAYWYEMLDLPDNVFPIIFTLFICGALGFGCGLIASLLNYIYPGTRRFYIVLLRIMGVTAGLFFVSEQLPEKFALVVIWNPILHAGQISRDGWFSTYESVDASLPYLLACTAGALLLGFALAIKEIRLRAKYGDEC